MDYSQLIIGVAELWSIFAIITLFGPRFVIREVYLSHFVVRTVLKPHTKGVLLFISEMLIVLYIAICFFGNLYGRKENLLLIPFVLFSYCLTCLVLYGLNEKIVKKVKSYLWWIYPLLLCMFVTQYKEGKYTWDEIVQFWIGVFWKAIHCTQVIVEYSAIVAKKIWYYVAYPSSVFFGVALPLWFLVFFYFKADRKTLPRKTHLVISFCLEYTLVLVGVVFHHWDKDWLRSYDSLFVLYGKGFCGYAVLYIGVGSLCGLALAYLVYSRVAKSASFKRLLKTILLLDISIIICQAIWDMSFMAALIHILRLIGAFILRSGVWKYGSAKVYGAISFVRGLTFQSALLNFWILVRQASLRGLVKFITILLTWQVLTSKPIKAKLRYWREKLTIIGKEKGEKVKEEWERFAFVVKLFFFAFLFYFILNTWDIIWPMFPKGFIKHMAYFINKLYRFITYPIRKLFQNRILDTVMLWITKRVSHRIANFSPEIQKKFRIFVKYKIGRRVVRNKKRYNYFNKEFRRARRFKRLEEIERRKGLLPGALRKAGATTDAAFGLTMTVADLAKDGVVESASIAMNSLGKSFTFAEKKRVILMASIHAFFDAIFSAKQPLNAKFLQDCLKGMVEIFKFKDPEAEVEEKEIKAKAVVTT